MVSTLARIAIPLAALVVLAPFAITAVGADDPALPVPCTELHPLTIVFDPACPPAIRPGAASSGLCTLNWVLTDGTDLYIGAAGHCAHTGERLRIPGIEGELGTVVYTKNQLFNRNTADNGDWALIRIDAEDRHLVNPSMCQFGGPYENVPGIGVRTPLPGEPVVHYGHGAGFRDSDETKGRMGSTLVSHVFDQYFWIESRVAGGDSGSPVRLLSGEAAGIAVGYSRFDLPSAEGPVVSYSGLVWVTRFDRAMEEFEDAIGKPLHIVRDTDRL